MTNELAVIPQELTAVALFVEPDGLTKELNRIEKEALAHVPDISTDAGRKAIASNAYKVARSKTHIRNLGESLIADERAKIKRVNEDIKRAETFLDDIKVRAREPLTLWEQAEKAREESEILAAQFEKDHDQALLDNEFFDLKRKAAQQEAELARMKAEQEERARAEAARVKAEKDKIEAARIAKEQAEAAEKQRIENERIAKEAAAKAEADRIEREKQIAKDAAEAAEKAAAKKLEDERIAAARKVAEEQLKAQREKEETERRHAAELAKIKAEQEAKEHLERERKIEAARVEAARIADQAHRDGIHKAAVESLVSAINCTLASAIKVVDAIDQGKVQNVSIKY